ncbi:transposase [Streptomyces brevispora]|uniref:Transposase n=1 Tax=Streptomyces brevispora TaxID=887462 RepID=A0ABZ1G463_9ACTN|nr:transposase [Streptomyces brevispora]WSC14664.1 transposase [Streptomyces brevispora]
MSDEQCSLIEPVIMAWKDRHRSVSGHQDAYAMREIVNAILYQGRTGCRWAYLPHDLPPKSATYYCFAAWRDDGTDQVIHRSSMNSCAVHADVSPDRDPPHGIISKCNRGSGLRTSAAEEPEPSGRGQADQAGADAHQGLERAAPEKIGDEVEEEGGQ